MCGWIQQGRDRGLSHGGSRSIAGMISVDAQRVTGAEFRPTMPAAKWQPTSFSGQMK
ncbi:hypothetical protein RE6C_05576 [Rhodopirellula europaea 6C]|uniref:Uncharacterized protein n=1 Tax=Rhodopirellula europaea 6C TaxID=1263867 RepID=M2AVY9_9BACT|nr:hypothetical protein RE6C_05576 [Rhodopirellula europaea 6C]